MAFGNMMNGTGGLGQRAAALRASNTPQQLQQGYEKSVKDGTPSLSYLMAISSLAEEVERRKRDIDAKMKPKEPGTILEQRAKKLKDLTVGQNTADKAKQVGSIAQLQQQNMQQNMQRMAQGAPQGAPQGTQMAPQAPPRMAANGGIIMQDAPNLQRMAGGGIVGFDPGGEVELSVTDAQLKRMGLTRAIWENELNAEGKRAYLEKFQPIPEEASNLRRLGIGFMDAVDRVGVPNRLARLAKKDVGPIIGDTSLNQMGEYVFGNQASYDKSAGDTRAALEKAEAIRNIGNPSAQAPAQASAQASAPIKGPFGPLDPSTTGTNSFGPRVGTNPNAAAAPLGGPRVGTSPNALSGIARAQVPELGQQRATAGIPTANIAGDAFNTSATRAGKLIGRDPKAAQRAAMLERYKAANIEAENLRKKTEFADTLAFSGGEGFGRGAVEVANRRSKLASAKDARLRNELGLEALNMRTDSADAGKQITAGESAAKAALEKLGRDQLLKFKKVTAQASSKMEKRKVYIDIVKAIADLRQKNLQAVGKDLAGRADILQLNREVQEGVPGAEKKLEDIYKIAEERASRQTTQVLTELEGIRRDLALENKGFRNLRLKQ